MSNTRWTPSGYPTPGAFAGAWMCRFRMTHRRDDGALEVCTLGHQVEKGGRLAPIMPGFNFLSVVMVTDGDNEALEIERAAANDAKTATALHVALMDRFAAWEPQQ